MSLYDLSIDEARARQWIQDVYSEVNSVELVLAKIVKAQQEMPGDGDSVIAAIDKTAETCNTVWKTMIKAFKESCGFIEEAIMRYAKAGVAAKEAFEETAKKVGY